MEWNIECIGTALRAGDNRALFTRRNMQTIEINNIINHFEFRRGERTRGGIGALTCGEEFPCHSGQLLVCIAKIKHQQL